MDKVQMHTATGLMMRRLKWTGTSGLMAAKFDLCEAAEEMAIFGDITGRNALPVLSLPTSMRGGNGNAAVIDTERTFRADQIVPIAEQFGMDPRAVLDKIRMEFLGREFANCQQELAQMLSRLINLAEEFNVAVYMTNRDDNVFAINLGTPYLTPSTSFHYFEVHSSEPEDESLGGSLPTSTTHDESNDPASHQDDTLPHRDPSPNRDPPSEPLFEPSSEPQLQILRAAPNWIPSITRGRYILTLTSIILLHLPTYQLFTFAVKNSTENSPCLNLKHTTPEICKFTITFLKAFGLTLIICGSIFLVIVHRIRPLINLENRCCSMFLFVVALILSNIPSLIYPQNNLGFWLSSSYHIFFWFLETSLYGKTGFTFHAVFASVNLTVALSILAQADSLTFLVYFRIGMVIVIAAGLHFVSHLVVDSIHTPNPSPNPNTNPNPSQYPNPNSRLPNEWIFVYWIRIFARESLWLFTVPIYQMRRGTNAPQVHGAHGSWLSKWLRKTWGPPLLQVQQEIELAVVGAV